MLSTHGQLSVVCAVLVWSLIRVQRRAGEGKEGLYHVLLCCQHVQTHMQLGLTLAKVSEISSCPVSVVWCSWYVQRIG